MELDILRHTGCQWSKIIYPGFRGNTKPFLDKAELFKSADKFEKDGILNPSSLLMMSPGPLKNTFMSSFNTEYHKLMDNSLGVLRN